ncbi:MAG: hypothetical protein C4326_15255 [Ignavibacteria bacterium]
MNTYSKLCDAADWFRPEIERIIVKELEETPRFHRKQWEFAMIFHVLRSLGKLGEDNVGLSMGGGKERVAYALARHVRQLVVTDLYESETSWDCARTDNPDAFIRRNKPFPVDDARLMALRMDMRDLHFPDRTFDFCYSTCAVEHIGKESDFLAHFNEVARVLKDDGVYVFTTEVLFGDTTVRDEHNYVFSLSLLFELFAQSNLVPEEVFNAHVAPHAVNAPLPSTLPQLTSFAADNIAQRFLQNAQHIQLIRGKHPFTCGIFVLRKRTAERSYTPARIEGLEETRAFAARGVKEYVTMLASSHVSLNPFGLLPGEHSRFYLDHAEFFKLPDRQGDNETAFHTDYIWFGTCRRVFDIALRVESSERTGKPTLEMCVHRFKTLDSGAVECTIATSIPVPSVGWMMRRLEVDLHEDYCYAVLAKVRGGTCVFDRIEIRSVLAAPSAKHQTRVDRSSHTVIVA